MLGNQHNYVVGHLYDDGEHISFSGDGVVVPKGPEDMFDEGNSMDLSPVKVPQREMEDSAEGLGGPWNMSGDMDDTFHFRRQTAVAL